MNDFQCGMIVGLLFAVPIFAVLIGKWIYWKNWSRFWEIMHKDLKTQNERLFERLKNAKENSNAD